MHTQCLLAEFTSVIFTAYNSMVDGNTRRQTQLFNLASKTKSHAASPPPPAAAASAAAPFAAALAALAALSFSTCFLMNASFSLSRDQGLYTLVQVSAQPDCLRLGP